MGLGNFAGGMAQGINTSVNTWAKLKDAKRLEEEYQRKQEYEAALARAAMPATTEARQGLSLSKDGQQLGYIPDGAGADIYRQQGYDVGAAPTAYSESLVGQGRTLGQNTDAPTAAKMTTDYNAQGLTRQRAVAMQYGKPQDAAAYMGLESGEIKLKQQKDLSATGDWYKQALADPAKALKALYDSNALGAGQGEHAGQTVDYIQHKDGSVTMQFLNKETGAPVGQPQVLSADQLKGAVNDAYFAKLGAVNPEFLAKNIDRLDKRALDDRKMKLEKQKADALEKYQNATTENQRKAAEIQLANIKLQETRFNSLYGQKQAGQELASYTLSQQKEFDKERKGLIDRSKLDPKDPEYLTRAQVTEEINWARTKFGGGGGPGKPAVEAPKPADVLKAMETMPRATFEGKPESDVAYYQRIAGVVSGGGAAAPQYKIPPPPPSPPPGGAREGGAALVQEPTGPMGLRQRKALAIAEERRRAEERDYWRRVNNGERVSPAERELYESLDKPEPLGLGMR